MPIEEWVVLALDFRQMLNFDFLIFVTASKFAKNLNIVNLKGSLRVFSLIF